MTGIAYTHAPAARTTVAVHGLTARFPVHRVYCVGRNYADHALEMGVDPRSEAPFFFCKPADTVVSAGSDGETLDITYPPLSRNLHHEVELVVAIGLGGADIPAAAAAAHIYGYAVGIDMTRRDLQQAMRKAGRPWEIGKTFDRCAPIGPLHRLPGTETLRGRNIALDVDGEPRQHSTLDKLIWSVPEIIADLSRHFTLRAGDLIFTGTPEGVGAVVPGQRMRATIDGLGSLQVRVVAAAEATA